MCRRQTEDMDITKHGDQSQERHLGEGREENYERGTFFGISSQYG